jgi:hypothetical protein
MKRILTISLISAFAFFLSGCFNFGLYNGFGPTGGLYSNYKVGISGSQNVKASKEGKACVTKISLLLTTGDASIEEAASDGGIKRIASVDKEGFGVLAPYIFSRLCTVVRGD